MKLLGNIIWLIFGGLHTAIEYFIAGLVLMITMAGKAGPVTIRNGSRIAHEQRRET